MKKKVLLLIACLMAFVVVLAACGNGENGEDPGYAENGNGGEETNGGDDNGGADDTGLPDGLYVDADGNYRFETTRHITVPLWCRAHDRIPEFVESYWAQWVADEVLAVHNIAIEWEVMPRWQEGDHLSMLLGGGAAPDVSMTFGGGIVDTFADMGGIIDLMPHLDSYRDLLPNLYGHLGTDIVYWNLNPQTNELFSLMGREAMHGRVVTFVREDWLAALDLDAPTNHEEFEEMLIAFRDRTDELPGDVDSTNVIPFGLGNDVLWGLGPIVESFIPSDISERDWFVYGWDDRRFMHREASYEALQLVNGWFNDDLMWGDLGVGESSDLSDQIRLGRVGTFMGNWDLAFRPADRYTLALHEEIGPDAHWVPLAPFPADNGTPQIFLANEAMRNIFFPETNTEILASLLYLDFMSRLDVLDYLQLGVQGVHWDLDANGNFITLPEGDDHSWPDYMVIPSGRNFDITITANGIADLGTLFYAYDAVAPSRVESSRNLAVNFGRTFAPVVVRPREAEQGMDALRGGGENSESRQIGVRLIRSNPAEFSANFDAEWDSYLSMGAGDIINEREQAWIEEFGDVDSQPAN